MIRASTFAGYSRGICRVLTAVILLSGQVWAAEAVEFTPLFNGSDLDGWEGNLDWFRVEDKAIAAGSMEKPVPKNEFLCTKTEYGDFELRLDVKGSSDSINGGIQIRSARVPDRNEVSGYQVDIGVLPAVFLKRMLDEASFSAAHAPESGNANIWGALYDEARRNRFLAVGDQRKMTDTVKNGDWNEIRVRCEGPHIQIWVNGTQTVDYTEDDAAIPRRGIIGLQIHSGPAAEIGYRNISIKEIAAPKE